MEWEQFPDKLFKVIYIDPPWKFDDPSTNTKSTLSLNPQGKTRSAEQFYPTVSYEDLKTLPIPSIAEKNCIMFMRTTDAYLDRAI